jgi:hypothetical protein
MQDFSTEFFILWQVLAGSYLLTKSLTSLYLLTTVYNWHHMSTSIYVSLRYVHNAFMWIIYCIYIIYDIDLAPNLGMRGHCDIIRTIDIL